MKSQVTLNSFVHDMIDNFMIAIIAAIAADGNSNSTLLRDLVQAEVSILIPLFVLIVGIVSAAFGFIGGLLKDHFISKQEEKIATVLETLRADINRDHTAFTASINSLSFGQQGSIERRLKAIEAMWDAMQKQRLLVSDAIFFYDILIPNEYDSVKSQEMVSILVRDRNEIIEKTGSLQREVEKYRPFLGELLWNLFKAYNIFLSRLTILITDNQSFTRTEDGKTLPWWQDKFMINLLKPIISNDDSSKKMFHGPQEIYPYMASWALSVLEQKILLEVDRIISGSAISDATLSQIEHISEAILKDKIN